MLYLFFSGEEVADAWEIGEEGGFDFEVLIHVEVEVLLAQPVLLEELH